MRKVNVIAFFAIGWSKIVMCSRSPNRKMVTIEHADDSKIQEMSLSWPTNEERHVLKTKGPP